MKLDEYFDYIEEFERINDLNLIKINDYNIWHLIKVSLFNLSNRDHFEHFSKKPHNFLNINIIKNLLYKPSIPTRIFAFTPRLRVLYKGKKVNKFLNFLPENNYETTFFELPSNSPIIQNNNEIVIPMEKIMLYIIFMEKIINRKIRKELINIFSQMKNKEYIMKNINYLSLYVSRYISSINFFKNYFKKYKPDIIFFVCHYCTINKGIIAVANEMNIPTVDIQHGLINKKSPGYISKTNLSNDIPKYLILYGNFFKEIILNNSTLFEEKNIIVAGNYFLSNIFDKKEMNRDDVLLITTQPAIEKEAYEKIINEANRMKLKVKLKIHPSESREKYLGFKNVEIISDKNLYDLLPKIKYHATVFSTSAIESLYFGVPNIIIPWKGYENQLDFLIDNETSILYNKPLEIIIKMLKSKKAIEKGKYFFQDWNQEKIDELLKVIL